MIDEGLGTVRMFRDLIAISLSKRVIMDCSLKLLQC